MGVRHLQQPSNRNTRRLDTASLGSGGVQLIVLQHDLVSSRTSESSAETGEDTTAPSGSDTGPISTAEDVARHNPHDDKNSRRHFLGSALGSFGGTVVSAVISKEAAAFPSPSLEMLQESAATSTTRCGGEAGISALRDPAIYRYRESQSSTEITAQEHYLPDLASHRCIT